MSAIALSKIENQRLAEQLRLDALKTDEERNRWGQFATPPALAAEMARHAVRLLGSDFGPVRFLEPAIGTGAFYAALRQSLPKKRLIKATGVELDSGFAAASARLWGTQGLKVLNADFTELPLPAESERFDLIVTNPPYVRHHHLPTAQKERLKRAVEAKLGIRISGLAGLYCYFLLLGDQWLAPNGIAAWLIPSEFMSVNYGEAIRRYLLNRVTLLQIHRFAPEDVQFADALVSSAVVLFRKVNPDSGHEVVFSYGGTLAGPQRARRIPVEELSSHERWLDLSSARNGAGQTAAGTLTIGELFAIKRGIATGANRFFVIPRSKAVSLGIPPEHRRPILPSPRFLDADIIEADSDGYPDARDPLCVIDCALDEAAVRERHPDFWTYLRSGREQGVAELYLPSRRSPWYAQEKRAPAPFLCTYMGRPGGNGRKPFRFIRNKSQAIAANVYLLLYPKGKLAKEIAERPDLADQVFGVLRSITTEMFLDESRVYGGGLFKLEPRELARVSAESVIRVFEDVNVGRQRRLFE